MEEKAEKPSETTAQVAEKKWHCPICGARIWLSNQKRLTRSKKHNDANYVLSEMFAIKLAYSHTVPCRVIVCVFISNFSLSS